MYSCNQCHSVIRSVHSKCEQVTDNMAVVRNSAPTEDGRGVLDQLQNYVQSHDVLVSLPGDTQLTLSSRNINNGEINLSLKFDQDDSADNAAEGKHFKRFCPRLDRSCHTFGGYSPDSKHALVLHGCETWFLIVKKVEFI